MSGLPGHDIEGEDVEARWARSRRKLRADAVRALPAAALALAWVAFPVLEGNRQGMILRYMAAHQQALDGKQGSQALRCARKLVILEGGSVSSRSRLSATLLELGRVEESRALDRELVLGLDGPDVAPVLRLSRPVVDGKGSTKAELEEIERVLERAMTSHPEDVDLHHIMARLQIRRGRPEAAVLHLERVAGSSPVLRLLAAETYRRMGRMEQAAPHAERVRSDVREALEKTPGDVQTRVLGIEACRILGDFGTASRLASGGLEVHGRDHALFRILRADLETRRLQALMAGRDPPLAAVLAGLLAVAREPEAPREAFGALVDLGRRDATLVPAVKAALLETLAAGQGTGLIHSLLGEIAWIEKKREEALAHFRVAARIEAGNPRILNNLAWTLAFGTSSSGETAARGTTDQPVSRADREAALALIEQALQRSPDNAGIRDTRGRILHALGREEEAIPDLEASLKTRPGDSAIRRMLATCYRAAGLANAARRLEEPVSVSGPARPDRP